MIDTLKTNFKTFAQGALFGLGFTLVAWLMYFAFHARTQEPMPHRASMETAGSPAAKDKHFIFRDVEEVKRNGRSYFVGAVKNNGASPASGLNIEVNLFMKGKFVDQYSTYLAGELGPGEERHFKVSCGCKDELPAEHDSYKIAIVGGY